MRIFLLFLSQLAVGWSTPLEQVEPESLGVSSTKLAEITPAVEKLIADGKLAGSAVLVLKKGKIIFEKQYGLRDRKRQLPIEPDTIFRIYSMTKALTSAGILMLMEEGKLTLDDPMQRHLTSIPSLTIFPDQPAKRQPTIRDLLRHTSGIGSTWGSSELAKKYRQIKLPDRQKPLSALPEHLAQVELETEPGSKWQYGVSTDILAAIVEKISGQTFDQFLTKRFLDPLGMKDTSFHVPAEKAQRLANTYEFKKGALKLKDDATTSRFLKEPAFKSGGSGLVSTMRDYARFLQMIANNGEFQGKNYLRKESVDLMRTNQLPETIRQISFGKEQRYGTAFGLGFCVRVTNDERWDPDAVLAEYGWGGLASTHYWISPKHHLVVITMEQTVPYNWNMEATVKPLIYAAMPES